MTIKGILFDLYGTLIDIETDESLEEIYRGIGHFLTYHGINLRRWEVRDRYYAIMKEQRAARGEEFPEIDVDAIWSTLLERQGMGESPARRELARVLAQMYRGISRKRLRLYPEVRRVLDELRLTYNMALVSDAQPCYALPEMQVVGLDGYFDPIIISANYGFRKPDARLMRKALDAMKLAPTEVVCVGNDMYRDIFGAQRLGIKTILVDSNQGTRSHENVAPDYFAQGFADVLRGIEALR
jgi:putative hydrolase of the HAD superfamily